MIAAIAAIPAPAAGRTGGCRPLTQMLDTQVGALDRFCREQYPRLVGMLGLYLHDQYLAEELAQDALVRLCRAWDGLPSDGDAQRWVTRVAFNLAKSSFRSRAARRRVLDRYGPSMATDPLRSAEAVADVMAVRNAVAALPERSRRAIILRYFADLSVAEVARLMECPEGTVKTLTRDGIARLRKAGLDVTDD